MVRARHPFPRSTAAAVVRALRNYCGSSPFLAPAHADAGGRRGAAGRLVCRWWHACAAQALAGLATANGAVIRYGCDVAEIATQGGRVSGVRLADGEVVAADSVIANADPQAVAAGRFGRAVQGAVARQKPAERSLSALTWTGVAGTAGFPLVRHNVFFSRDYRAEFDALAQGKRCPPSRPSMSARKIAGDTDAASGVWAGAAAHPRQRAARSATAVTNDRRRRSTDAGRQRGDLMERCGLTADGPGTLTYDLARRNSRRCSRRRGARSTARRCTGRRRASSGRPAGRGSRACIWPGARRTLEPACRWRRCPVGWRRRR